MMVRGEESDGRGQVESLRNRLGLSVIVRGLKTVEDNDGDATCSADGAVSNTLSRSHEQDVVQEEN